MHPCRVGALALLQFGLRMNYLTALQHFHSLLRPASYVEIGCRHGISLAQSHCPSLAIDPDFEITQPLTAPTRIFRETSDEFFAARDLSALLEGPVDLAFVDGMHRADYVLRDILNLERHASGRSVIVIDDVLPEDISWTSRERNTQAWTGDVYKIIPFLRRHRPDLAITVFDIKMKGLAVIHRLDPANQSLQAQLARHEAALAGDSFALGSAQEIRRQLDPQPVDQLPDFIAGLKAARDPNRAPKTDLGTAAQVPYLDLLKRSLLNEIYLDDELRIQYLRRCLEDGEEYSYQTLHDIRQTQAPALDDLKLSRQVGRFPGRDIRKSGFSHTMMGRLRLDSLHSCLDHIQSHGIVGDLVECGVWRGGGCILMAGWTRAHAVTDRQILVADSFEGLPAPSLEQDKGLDLSKDKFPQLAVSETTVRDNFAAYGLLDDRVSFLKGWFCDTLQEAPTQTIALLRMDGDLYESTMDTLVALYDRVSPGGVVIVDDYGALAVCRQALEDFFANRAEDVPALHRIDWTGAYFYKPATADKGA